MCVTVYKYAFTFSCSFFSMLNIISKQGASSAQAFGTVGKYYLSEY
jgi:hypothetical protein